MEHVLRTLDWQSPSTIVIIDQNRLPQELVRVELPAFDVTPADLVTAVVTERRVVRPGSRR